MLRTSLTTLLLAASAAPAAEFKAAYVDFQRALTEVDEGKAAQSRFEAFAKEKKKGVDQEQDKLKAEVEAFQKQSATMADEARRKKEDELQRRGYEFAQKAEKVREEIQEQERKELSTISPKLQKLLGDIAVREGFTMVFDRGNSGLAWAPPALDLTNELIRAYNNTHKVAGGAASATKPKDAPGKDAPAKDAPKK